MPADVSVVDCPYPHLCFRGRGHAAEQALSPRGLVGGQSPLQRAGPHSLPAVSGGDWYLAVVNRNDQATTYTLEVFMETPADTFTDLFFPYLIEYQNWHSEISLLNGDERETISGVLTAYDQFGTPLAGAREVVLGPNARADFSVATAFPNPGEVYYAVFSSDAAAMIRGYARIYVNGLYRAALPATTQASAGVLNIPHIASDSQWSTEISLLNTSSENRDVTLTFNTGQVITRSLAPAAFDTFTIRRLFGGQPQPLILSAKIGNAAGGIGVELFQNNDLRIMEGLLLDDAVVEELFFPHIAIEGGWATGVAIYNPSAEPCDLTLTPFDAFGNALLPPFYSTISENEKYIGNVALLGFPAAAAWVGIEASRPVYGFELFMQYNQMGGYAAVNLSGRQGFFPKVGSGDVTGIAFINQGAAPASVQLTAYGAGGEVVAGQALALAARQKRVAVADDYFDDDLDGVTHIRFVADQKVVGFELNFSPDGALLDGLGAVLLSEPAEIAGAGIVDLAVRALAAGDLDAFVSLLSGSSRGLVEAMAGDFSLTGAAGFPATTTGNWLTTKPCWGVKPSTFRSCMTVTPVSGAWEDCKMKPRFFPALLLASLLLPLLASAPVRAWNNKGTHPAINDWAIRVFEKNLRSGDQSLAASRLDGADCYGVAWDPQDGTANTTQSIAVNRKKALK